MIYVIGSSNTDMVVKCVHLPKPGETVLGGEFICVQGGKGANQAVAAARLGAKTRFVCKVGDDSNGKNSLAAYQQEGIDTSFIQLEKDGTSGVALILVDEQGENSIAVASGTNATLAPNNVESALKEIQPNDILLMQLEIPLETVIYAAKKGKEREAMVILDPAPAPGNGLPDEVFASLDFILPNETEAAMLTGENQLPEQMADVLFNLGVKNVIITLGRDGCVLRNENGVRRFEGFQVKAVDSTAAGDALAGALAASLSNGTGIESAIVWAQTAAAISVTKSGAQPSLPTKKEIESFAL